MSKEREIRIGIKTALGTITYDGAEVPLYDITRDDAKNPHIYVAAVDAIYAGTKSNPIWNVRLHIGVHHKFDGTYEGSAAVDAIGDDMEAALASPITVAGFTNVIQYLKRSFYSESSNKTVKDLIKLYIYELVIQEN